MLIEQALVRPEVSGVVLYGEAGVGKTRLARETLDRARARSLTTEWVVATQAAASLPFGALAHLLPSDLPRIPGRLNLIRVASEALRNRWGEGGAVVGIDDAHLLDDASAALVHALARTGPAAVVVTVRSGEQAPDPITALWKDGLAERIDVQVLSRDETRELVEAVLESPIEEWTLRVLWTQSQGNALFLRELVQAGLESGALVKDEDVWRWQRPVRTLPRLIEVIERRLGHLNRTERAALEVVAVAEVLEVSLLEAVVPAGVIERLERRGLLVESVEGDRVRVYPSHPLFGEAIKARMPGLRARNIQRLLADALAGVGARRREDLMRLAVWTVEGRARVRPDLLTAAAHHALALHEYGLGERVARAAIEAGGGFDAGQVRAEALIGLGQHEEADALLARVQESATGVSHQVHAAIARAWLLFRHLGRVRQAEEIIQDMEARVEDEGGRELLAAVRADMFCCAGRTQAGADLALAIFGKSTSELSVAYAGAIAAWALIALGRTGQALSVIDRSLHAALRRSDDLVLTAMNADTLLGHRSTARGYAGRIAEAAAIAEERYEAAVEKGYGHRERAYAATDLGIICELEGRIRTAARWFREALTIVREADPLHESELCLAYLAGCEALVGHIEAAERAVIEAEVARRPWYAIYHSRILGARAWIAAARGEMSNAASVAIAASEVASRLEQPVQQAIALHDAARLGDARAVAGQLRAVTEEMDAPLIQAFALHAEALARDDAEALTAVSQAFEEMGALLLAAEAASETARILSKEGRKGSALTAESKARVLAARCEGARTPALASIGAPLPLTAREREIGTLAARGLSSREIARRLVVSVRTVDNHLHRAYVKLGVNSREELAAILEPVGDLD